MSNSELPISKNFTQGTDVVPAIEKTAASLKMVQCSITGIGQLNRACLEGEDARPVQIDGPLKLLSLNGRVKDIDGTMHLTLMCTLALTGAGFKVQGGRLLSAEAQWLDVTFTKEQPQALIEHNAYTRTPAGKPSMDQRWAQAMDLSAALSRKQVQAEPLDESTDDDDIPEIGDIVKHAKFGDCRVVKLDDTHMSIQNSKGRILQLGLGILQFTNLGTDGSKQVWQVTISR